MAVIGSIRKRVGLLIGVVGVSMVLFILGDLLGSNSSLFSGSSDVVGEIGGEEIHYQEFEQRVDKLIENYKMNTRTETVDQNTTDMLREQAWNMFVNDNTLGKEYEKLGLSCSAEELFDMVAGNNPHPQVQQAFTDPNTKMFDKNAVLKFLKDLPNRDENVQQQWKNFEDAIRDERIAEKYRTIIKGGIFVTTAESKANYMETGRLTNLRFVRLDYNSIPDSSVKVEESDLQAYYNANQNKYRQPETTRKVEYVAFDVTPSADDRQETATWINDRKAELTTAEDPAAVVNRNADTPYDSNYFAKGTLSPAIDTVLFGAAVGTVVGPYEDGGAVKVSRLVAQKMVPDSVKARHILLSIENGDTAKARNTADSLRAALKKGADFATLATAFSKDPGSAAKGGDLGWFRAGTMVKEFNDACFDGKVGDMPIVTSQFGVHLIEVTGKGNPTLQIRVATVDRKIEPSQSTYDAVYGKANSFAANNTSAADFDSSIVKEGLNKRIADNIRENDKNIAGLDQPRELVRWAYQAKKDDISKVFTFGDKFVIAKLTDIREKGILPLDAVRDQVTAEARKKKKGDMLIEKMNATGAKSVDDMAAKLNTAAMDADNVSFASPFVPGLGNEPKLVGTAFGLKAGQLSKPVAGDNGVCVLYVKSFTEPAPTTDYSSSGKQLSEQRRARSEYEVSNALKEAANVEDNRGKFY